MTHDIIKPINDNTKNMTDNITIYKSEDGIISFNVNIYEETVWLTQKQMGVLFDRDRSVIAKHISNIFSEGELKEKVVCAKFEQTTQHGAIQKKTQTNEVKYYNLDVIISVGYRVKSQRGIQFRKWATSILKQYLLNGYAVNERRIKQIESKVDDLVNDNKLLREDVDGIKNLLLKLIERPIVIHNHNQISLTTSKLEEKIIELLDQLINETKDKQIVSAKEAIKAKDKNKISAFFKELGDENSNLNKKIKGVKTTKKIIQELIKLWIKFKNIT
jgi:hypothetical protein